jgi:DDE family transposase
MQTRRRLLHAWTRQVRALLPAARATRVATLALLTLGLLWAQHVALPRIAAAVPLGARDPSTERRLRRWLANPAVTLATLWTPLLPSLLAGIAGPEVVFAFDLTPHGQRFTILSLGLVCHKRVLPLGWRIMPQQTAWPEPLPDLLRAMAAPVQAALPAAVVVTVVADRGLVGHKVIDACQGLGWQVVLRLKTGGGAAAVARLADGREQRVAALPTQPGQRWDAPAAICKDAGWRAGYLTIRWDREAAAPLVLFSTRPGGSARVREYRRRMLAEASFQDCKTRGWQLERSKLAADRLERLLIAVALAFWWAHGLGLRAIHAGHRPRFDRTDRRDLSVIRLGRRWLDDLLAHDQRPPLPFRHPPPGWRFRWLA